MFSLIKHGRLALLFAFLFCLASVDQATAACSGTLTPEDRTHGYGATTAKVSVAASSGCTWSVVNNTPWITILSGTSGTGDKDVTYALEGNPNPGNRQGVIQIAGKNFTVTQTGVLCTYEINPTFHNKCPYSSTGSVQVSTPSPCAWTVSSPVDWVVITDGENSVGSGKVYFTVLENPNPTPRTAVLTIAGLPFTINQAAYASLTCAAGKQVECGSSWTFDAPAGQGSTPTVLSTTTNHLCGSSFVATRVWSFSDPCGSVGVCTQAVTVVDSTPPVLVCAADKTVDCSAPWGFDAPSATDACDTTSPSVTIVSTITHEDGLCGFRATRTWRATDACGNASTCSQTVTVVDSTPPTISCAGNKSAECGAGWSFDLPAAIDACSGAAAIEVAGTLTNHGGLCGGTFSVTRTWTAIDDCGNVSMCSQTVTIVDTTPPTISCAGDKIAECGAGWAFDPPTATDSCGTASVLTLATLTNNNGFCEGSFRVTRSWTAIDGCGNVSVCIQTVTVVDTTPPALTCAANKSAECGAVWTFDPPTAIDGCSATVSIQIVGTVTNSSGVCGGTFSATRTWSAADGCGNTVTCHQIVTVVDTTPPAIVCADDKIAECGMPWSFDPPLAIDSCSANVTIQTQGTTTNRTGFCGGTFSATRTWRATDECGNSSMCSQTVTVVDTQPPQLSCAPAQAVPCGTAWDFTPPAVIDLCDGTTVPLRIVGTVTNGNCGQTLTATRTWETEDGCGNKATCSQTVTVESQGLEVACAPDRAVNCADLWTFDLPTAQSGCAAVVRLLSTTTNGLCGRAFSATRLWEISDGCTNVFCQQTINVRDNPPVVICAGNRLVSCEIPWNFEAPQVTDDCGYEVRVLGTVTNLLCGPSYTATRTWEVTDGCTNMTCTQTVQVLDQTPPVIVCLPDITVTNLIDVPHCAKSFTEFFLGGGQASDACDTFRYRCIEGSLVPTPCGYTIERLHTVIDNCGNSNSCVQRITITTCQPAVARPVLAEINLLVNGGIKLKITGAVGHTYNVLRGTELGKPWNVIGAVTLDEYGLSEFVDPTGISGACRMYRLVEP